MNLELGQIGCRFVDLVQMGLAPTGFLENLVPENPDLDPFDLAELAHRPFGLAGIARRCQNRL